MRRIVDFSDYQAGLDLDTVAGAVDGAWAKAGDWSWIASHNWPGDDVHTPAINRFKQLGKPVGSYLFVRPGWTDPATQIDQWRRNTPDGTTLKPMVDLETAGTLSGGSLTDWVSEALRLTADRFEVPFPVLYWSASFQAANGMGVPQTPHLPMVAEYHRGYEPFLWADLAGWEVRAYGKFGGPDVPAGYSGLTNLDLIWQFTSSAQIPGFGGLVDCSFCNETRWQQLGNVGSIDETEGWLTVAAKDDILAAVAAMHADLAKRVYSTHDAVNARADALGAVANATRTELAQAAARINLTADQVAVVQRLAEELRAMGGTGGPDPASFAAAVKQAFGKLLLEDPPP